MSELRHDPVGGAPATMVKDTLVVDADVHMFPTMKQVKEWLGSDDLLMFSSDDPHGHERDVSASPDVVPASAHAEVMAGNALDHYRIQ